MAKILKPIFTAFLILGLGLFLIRPYNLDRVHIEKETRVMMDTYVTISAIGPQSVTSQAVSSAFGRMEEIAAKFNSLDPSSPIYAFNRNNKPISDREILGLINKAQEVSRESDGAFDITVATLLELWGFYGKEYRIPQDQEIKDCLKKVGYQHLSIKNGELIKDNPGTEIDLGGVAKGYALAEALKVLKIQGVVSALIDAGGDVYALGKKGRKLWRIGLRNPRGEDLLGYMEVEDLAVMGSGDYERFFIKDGKRYHHIFNPKTGYPTEGVTGVTLIYADPVLGQILGKIPFVMGPKKGLELLEKIPGLEAGIVLSSGDMVYSPGFKHALKAISETK